MPKVRLPSSIVTEIALIQFPSWSWKDHLIAEIMPLVPREKYLEMNWRAADKVATWKLFKRQSECDLHGRHNTSTRNRREFKLNVTDPDLVIPIKQTRVTTRHSDLREPQPSSSDSQPASSQPVSETTTSESSVSLPSSPSGSSSTESTSTSVTDSSSSETPSESSSQPSSNALSPETSSSASTSQSMSPELLEMEHSFNSLLAGTRDQQSCPVMRSQMDNLRDQQQCIAILKQVASQPQNQPRPVSAPKVANMPLPRIPEDVQVTRGLRSRCRQRMLMRLVRAVTQRQTDYRTFKKSLVDA